MTKGRRKSEIISSRERLLLLIENTKEYAIIILDPFGRIEDWNKGAKHLIGYSEKEIVGKNFKLFFTHEDRKAKKPEKELQKAKEEGRAEDDNWIVRKDGSRFWASGLTVAILDKVGNQVGFAKIMRDLTDKRELEQQKDDFLAIASHELRTPLTVAALHRQMLEKHLKEQNDQKGLVHFNKVSHAMDQLDQILRNLFSTTKMQHDGLENEKEILSLEKIAKEIVSEIQKTTLTHKIIVKGHIAGKVLANRAQIEEVLTNLLTNAIKYSPKAKRVVISLKEYKEKAEVAVMDYGIGIDKKNLYRIFDRFYRTPNSRDKKLPGLGLGLYIAKRIIENHKGQLGVKSTFGRGSVFYFTLPLIN